MLIAIAALATNRVIGREGQLPWRLPGDLKHFRQSTLGGVVVMGRTTYQSLGKSLPQRENWVLTGQADFQAEGVRVFHSLSELLQAAADHPQVWIIGGGQVYAQLLPFCQRQLLTLVEATPQGDAYYPEFALDQWKLIEDRPGPQGEAHAYRFLTYERDEAARQASLERLHILETPGEARYDRLTREARRVTGAPFSMLTLIDGERQWFKSTQGHTQWEGPRAVAFCAYTLLAERHLIVDDAAQDERFARNPAVTSGMVRFYAGVPIEDPQGHRVGSLCVVDSAPHHLSQEQLQQLEQLAHQVEKELHHPAHFPALPLDPITRCWARQAYDQLPPAAALLRIDLHGTQKIAENWGQPALDLLLKEYAEGLRQSLRPGDQLVRWSENQILLLSQCPPTHLEEYRHDLLAHIPPEPPVHADLQLRLQITPISKEQLHETHP